MEIRLHEIRIEGLDATLHNIEASIEKLNESI
jgi:hypothetical protein